MPLEERFGDAMHRLLAGDSPPRIGLAVSGGSDSIALMYLASGWAASRGVELWVLTVDHGLRPEAAGEARRVRAQAGALGISHATIRWQGWDGTGNLQDAARRARRRFLWQWGRGLGHILLGHTMEDQAETVIRHLARGSGVAGLSGMDETSALPRPPEADPLPDMEGISPPLPQASEARGPRLLRPLLSMRRAELREWLIARDVAWSEDPSNNDDIYARVRARKALAAGNALGLTVEGLAETARRQRRARQALEAQTQEAALRLARISHGDILLEPGGLAALADETRFDLLARALCWVSSAEYRPRMAALERVWGALAAGRAATLHGCVLQLGRGGVRISRERRAVAGLVTAVRGATRWDNRWVIAGAAIEGCTIRAAGEEGVRQARTLIAASAVPQVLWPPHASLLAAPAVFRGADLVALPPFAGQPCTLRLDPPAGRFAGVIAPS